LPSRSLLLPLLFALSLAILSPGITSVSIFTDPDEYHRIHRTVLSMMEDGEWIAPRLDGRPRVRKPPLTYWMTRVSFELFGVSVTSGRVINVFFAALLVVVVALIGFEYDKNSAYGVSAALIALSMLGMGISSKFLMHDLSAAALSGLAFYFFLVWSRTGRPLPLFGMSAALTAGFFIKGPVVWVVAGSGIGSLFLTKPAVRSSLWRSKWSPTGEPGARASPPVGRNPEQEPPAKAGDRVEGSRSDGRAFQRQLKELADDLFGTQSAAVRFFFISSTATSWVQ